MDLDKNKSSAVLWLAATDGKTPPTIEAAACGLRVIGSGWTATPELIADGWLVEGQPMWDPMQGSWWMVPSVMSTIEALEKSYAAPRGPSQAQITHAAKYDADYVFNNQWKPVLEALQRLQQSRALKWCCLVLPVRSHQLPFPASRRPG